MKRPFFSVFCSQSVRSLPGSNDSILGSEAVNRSVLHAESNHSFTLSIFHQKVQGKVLNKVTGVITKRLNRRQRGRKIHEMSYSLAPLCTDRVVEKMENRCVDLPFHKVYAVASVLSCLLHSSIGVPGLLFHTWDSDHQRPSGRSSHLQCGWTACQSSPAGKEVEQHQVRIPCCVIYMFWYMERAILMVWDKKT